MIGDSWKDDGFEPVVTDPPTAAPTGWKGDEWKDDGFERSWCFSYFAPFGPYMKAIVSDPTLNPTLSPTLNPTMSPTLNPTLSPTLNPTLSPSESPTASPVWKGDAWKADGWMGDGHNCGRARKNKCCTGETLRPKLAQRCESWGCMC
eukprot:scaffold2498_cov74-Cyclotella_meneghiniana.AAC.2